MIAESETEENIQHEKFTKMYSGGWTRLQKMIKDNPGASSLYAFFAEHIDYSCGAVVADQTFLATRLGVSVRTIQRRLNYLEENKAIARIPVSGNVCAYALDPEEVWKGQNKARGYAAFNAKTLVNMDGEIERRIQSMFSSRES